MLVTNPLAPRSWGRDIVKSVSSGWWVLLLSGIVSIVAGGFILIIDWSVNDLAVFLGALFIIRGVFNMLSLPLDGSMRGWAVALGLIEVGVGIAVLVWPDPTLLVIAAFIGWWILFSGVMTIVGSISARRILPYWACSSPWASLKRSWPFGCWSGRGSRCSPQCWPSSSGASCTASC